MPRIRPAFGFIGFVPGLTLGVLLLTGCSGVYFNTTFNAEKAHKKALSLKADRLRQNPDDTVLTSPDERTQLMRAVVKSSKVLELWPTDPKYAPLAVYRIAECQYLMNDYGSAAFRYDEFIRAFPKHENVPMARVRRAQAAFLDGKMLTAREALADAFAANLTGEARREALLLQARLRLSEQTGALDAAKGGDEALAVYEQLLGEGAFATPESRNEIRWLAAQLAFDLGYWEKARAFALQANEDNPPVRIQLRNRKLAVLASYGLNRRAEGLAEVKALQGKRAYRAFRADLKVLEARGIEPWGDAGAGDWPAARARYREAVRLAPRQPAGAEAWYRVARYYLESEGREDSARAFFDSSVSANRGSEYGTLAVEKSAALKRLHELRVMDSAAWANDSLATLARPDSLAKAARDSAAKANGDTLALADSAKAKADSLAKADDEPQEDTREAAAAREKANKEKAKVRVVPKPPSVQYAPFMIAELFHFRLGDLRHAPDSTRKFLARIVADTAGAREDSLYTRRAFYALAWLEQEGPAASSPPRSGAAGSSFTGDKARADALYRALMARYPATEWAKAAERNLGLPPSVKTPDDSARALFLQAEAKSFAGEDLFKSVVPAYRAVVTKHPQSADAARAQFAIAFLTEDAAGRGKLGPPGQPLVDTVKVGYALVRDTFANTPQATEAERRLAYLGAANADEVKPEGKNEDEGGDEPVEDDSGVPRSERVEDSAEQDLY